MPRACTASTSNNCDRSATGSGPPSPTYACHSTRPTIPPTPRAMHSIPSRSSRPGNRAKGQLMATIRYGARPPEQQRNREVEAVTAPIWSTAVTVVWETDPDVIRAVLPPPLEPSESRARIRFATVDMGTGIPTFGAGWFGVRARHAGTEGEYALFMPMTTEQATIGGRETFGEPKKIGGVTITLDGDRVTARMERMGFVLAEVAGTLGGPIEVTPKD